MDYAVPKLATSTSPFCCLFETSRNQHKSDDYKILKLALDDCAQIMFASENAHLLNTCFMTTAFVRESVLEHVDTYDIAFLSLLPQFC